MHFAQAFVKFGRHAIGIRAINPEAMVDWLLKNNKKLENAIKYKKRGCKDPFFVLYLYY